MKRGIRGKHTLMRLLSLVLCVILLLQLLPMDVFAEFEIEVTCCGCGENYSWTYQYGDYDDVLQWVLENRFATCCGCCSYCYDKNHCADCETCLLGEVRCPICNKCRSCYETDGDHCSNCGKHVDVECYLCTECDNEMCFDCHNKHEAWCMECGACLYAIYDSGDICKSFDHPGSEFAHCSEHCIECEICENCYLHKQDEYCFNCDLCIPCAVEHGKHCTECEKCFETFPKCEYNEENVCEICCILQGNHCVECLEHVIEWCPTGGEGSHCIDNCEKETCLECGICFECAAITPCPDCDLCQDCCLEASAATGCSCGICRYSAAFAEHICQNCGEPICAIGGEFCEFCGLCENCCLAASAEAGCECGLCVEDSDFSDPEHMCEQCGERLSCTTDFCDDCGLCEYCCAENSAAAGCSCGDEVCVESADWEDHYCADCGHCVVLCDCDSSCTCEKCGAAGSFEHTHVWDADGYCTLCGAGRDGIPVISVQPRPVIHGEVSDPEGDYYKNQFTISIRVRDDAKCQWYISTSETGTGTALEDYYDEDAGWNAVTGAQEEVLTAWIPVDACETTYYYYCLVTNPDNGKTVRSSSARLEAKHNYRYVYFNAGLHTEVCVGCSEERPGAVRAAHQFGSWVYSSYATTTETGKKYHKCLVCGWKQSVSTPKLDPSHVHEYTYTYDPKDPGAGHYRICDCGRQLGSVQPHNFYNWSVSKFPTPVNPGEQYRECRDCGYKETEALKPVRYHEHHSFEQDESEAYLREYRQLYDRNRHWFSCDEVGCNEKFDIQPHKLKYRMVHAATEDYGGYILGECTSCPYYKRIDYNWKLIPVAVSDGKTNRIRVKQGQEFTITPRLPDGYVFYRWIIEKGSDLVTMENPYARTQTLKMKKVGADYKGDMFIWIRALYDEADTTVALSNFKENGKGFAMLHPNHTLYPDGTVTEDGYEDFSRDPKRIAYFTDDNVLYLSNYHGGPIEFNQSELPKDLKIVLQGESNSIDVVNADAGIAANESGGDLEITSETGSPLEIRADGIESLYGIRSSLIPRNGGSVTISGKANIRIILEMLDSPLVENNARYLSCGIYANRDLTIKDQASVYVWNDSVDSTGRKDGRVYEANALRARDNVNINTSGKVDADVCMSGGTSGNAIRAKNIFYDKVGSSYFEMGGSLRPFLGYVEYDNSLSCRTVKKVNPKISSKRWSETTVAKAALIWLPNASEMYSVNIVEDLRKDHLDRFLASRGDTITLQVQVNPGYVASWGSCLYLNNTAQTPKKVLDGIQIYEIPIKGDTILDMKGVRAIDPFASVSKSFTALRNGQVHLQWQMNAAELALAREKSTYANPIVVYVQKYTGGKWVCVEDATAKLAAHGSVDFTDPAPAASGSADRYRFTIALEGIFYYSDEIQVTRTDDPSQVSTPHATAVELYTVPGNRTLNNQIIPSGYPAPYDDGRSWIRLDENHPFLNVTQSGNSKPRYEASLVPMGSYAGEQYELAAEFDAERGTLIIYGDKFKFPAPWGWPLGAIRAAADSIGTLKIAIVGQLDINNDTTTFYRSGGKRDIEPAAISNPGGGIQLWDQNVGSRGFLTLDMDAEADGTKAGGALRGFTAVGIDAAGDVRIEDTLDVSVGLKCSPGATAQEMGSTIGIRAGESILLSDYASVSVWSTGRGDRVQGLLAGEEIVVYDSACVEMSIDTSSSSKQSCDSSCMEAGDSVVISTDKACNLQLEQNNPGSAAGVKAKKVIHICGEGDMSCDVYGVDGSYCFDGAEAQIDDMERVFLSWNDGTAGQTGGDAESGLRFDSWKQTCIGPARTTVNSIKFYSELIVPGQSRTIRVRPCNEISYPPGFQVKCGDDTLSISGKDSITVPAGAQVTAGMPKFSNGYYTFGRYMTQSSIPMDMDFSGDEIYEFTMPDCDVELIPLFEREFFYNDVPRFYLNNIGPRDAQDSPLSGTISWDAWIPSEVTADLTLQYLRPEAGTDDFTVVDSWTDDNWTMRTLDCYETKYEGTMAHYIGKTVVYRDSDAGWPATSIVDPNETLDPEQYARFRICARIKGADGYYTGEQVYSKEFVIDWDKAPRGYTNPDGYAPSLRIPDGPVGQMGQIDLSKYVQRIPDTAFEFVLDTTRDGKDLCPGYSFHLDALTGILSYTRLSAQPAVPWHSVDGWGCSFYMQDTNLVQHTDRVYFTVGTVFDAEDYGVCVGDTMVTSYNAHDVLGDGTVRFDPETLTLTLNNADIRGALYQTGPADSGAGIYAECYGKTLTIDIPAGTTSVICGAQGAGKVSAAIDMVSRTSLCLTGGGTLNVMAGPCAYDAASHGIRAWSVETAGDMTVNTFGGDCTSEGYGTSYGLLAMNQLTLSDRSVVIARGGAAKNSTGAVPVAIEVNGGVLAACGGSGAITRAPDNASALQVLVGDKFDALNDWNGSDSLTGFRAVLLSDPGTGKDYNHSHSSHDCLGGTPTCTQKAVCVLCTQPYGSTIDHDYHDGICSMCGKEDPGWTKSAEKPAGVCTGDHCPGAQFVDMPKPGNWAHDPIDWAILRKITNGTDPTHFSPNATCTRGQVVTFLWRAQGSPEPKGDANPFTDVKPSSYCYKAVLWAVEKGITKGTSATKFSPNDGCTRGQVVTFLWRAEGTPEPVGKTTEFKDLKESAFYYKAVLWAVEQEITNGTDATHFSPNLNCTRAQIVTFLYRAIK